MAVAGERKARPHHARATTSHSPEVDGDQMWQKRRLFRHQVTVAAHLGGADVTWWRRVRGWRIRGWWVRGWWVRGWRVADRRCGDRRLWGGGLRRRQVAAGSLGRHRHPGRTC